MVTTRFQIAASDLALVEKAWKRAGDASIKAFMYRAVMRLARHAMATPSPEEEAETDAAILEARKRRRTEHPDESS